MSPEVLAWTIVFIGGDLVILVALLVWAVRKDRQKVRDRDAA